MNKPVDQKARDIIIEELDKNLLVEAGAGSGKTTSLVDRMVQTIKKGKFKINEIAAITFTRKAALEMQERFQTVLEKEYRECTNIEVKERLEVALKDINMSCIGTVHAFCSRLLRERPVEAGIDPEFKEEEETGDVIHSKQAWMEYTTIMNSYFPDLEKLGIDPGDLQGAYKQMCTYPDVEWMTQKVDKPDLEEALAAARNYLNRVRNGIPESPITDKDYDELQQVILKAIRLDKGSEMKEDYEIIKYLRLFKKNNKITQNRWTSKEDAKDAKFEADILYEESIGPVINQWQVYSHYYITEFLKGAVKYYEDYRTRTSCLNFQDLLMKTATLLKENTEVRGYFQGKYKSLVVDEFQDTDPIQAEIIFYLTGENIGEKNWQALVPKPGSLFVVGDPKQSIYRFMRADIDTYNLVRDLIIKNGGEVVKLTTNFRSTKSIGDYLNPIFEKAFKGMSHQADYAPIDTFNLDKGESDFGVRFIEIPEDCSNKADVIGYEAQAIAKIIRAGVDGAIKLSRNGNDIIENPTYKDFMILTKTKPSMELYAKALEEYGIPVKMTGASSIGESFELHELLSLLKCLDRIDNQIYLIAVLKGLFFGLSDNALYEFKISGGSFNIFSQIPECLDDKYKGVLEEAFSKLKKYYRWTRKYNPSIVVEKIIGDLGLIQYANLHEMNKSRVGMIYDVVERMAMEESSGVTEFRGIVKSFENLLESGLEEELDIYIEENRVRVMNLHKAKGLEASVVFLANPKSNYKHDANYHIKRVNNIAKGYFIYKKSARSEDKSKKSFGGSSEILGVPKDWETYAIEENGYLEAEYLRLVYVAATRAKNLLILSSSCKDNKTNPWGMLLENISDDQILDVPEVEPVVKESREFSEISKEVVSSVSKACESWSKSLSTCSYGLSSPTAIKDGDLLWSVERVAGGGRNRGSAVHYILEELVKGEDNIDLLIDNVIFDFELELDSKDELLAIVEKFKLSDLWQRLDRSKEKYVEVPFSVKIEEEHRLYDLYKVEDSVPVVLSGVIDLIFREDDGWVVVDYKSDRVAKDEDYALLEMAYRNQLDSYSVILSEITGELVKAQEIVFLERLN